MKIVMDDLMNVKVVYAGKPFSVKSTSATTVGSQRAATAGGQEETLPESQEGGEETTAGEETTGEEITTGEEGEATTGAEDPSENGEETTEGMDNGDIPAGDDGLDVDVNAGGTMIGGDGMMGGGDMMGGGEIGTGTGDTGVKDPLLSSWPFVIGISAATLAVSIGIGILLAKLKIKKGFELYED